MGPLAATALALTLAGCTFGATRPSPSAPDVPELAAGFTAQVVMDGLERPTAMRFGPDGRAWIAEQAGRIKVFDKLSDPAPAVVADLTDHVAGRSNRGLLGLAPDPADATAGFALYAFPAPPGVDDPVWNDEASNCPDGTARSCVSTGVLSRITFDQSGATETRLLRGWCHHHASHTPNDLLIGADGALYVSAGEGSVPELPLDDGTWLPESQRCNAGAFASRPPPAERGPGEWAGAIVRFAAADLDAVASGAQSSDWLADRAQLTAYGLRNPFRMTFRPGTDEIWIGDPGWATWEEIDVVAAASDGEAEDFGWPCREGPDPAPNFSADARCATLTADPSLAVGPWFAGRAGQPLGPNDACTSEPASISGIAFGSADWPAPYADAVFFADFSRQCLYAIGSTGGTPDSQRVEAFWSDAGTIVDLTRGPDGALYAVDFGTGTVTRLAPAKE